MSTRGRCLALLCAALGLAGCHTWATYPQLDRPRDEIASLEGYFREYLIYSGEIFISAVDGERMAGFPWAARRAELAPGDHWIEFTDARAVAYSAPQSVCVLQYRFEAGHAYRFKAHSRATDVPWFDRRSPYRGTVVLVDESAGEPSDVVVTTLCADGGGSFCYRKEHCSPHPDLRCLPTADFDIGMCGFPPD
ncbi:hypothetical protein [Niveibacterium sp. COAC-50]|uniref:hypothetical protein n=1 Tax=Niveibacterium sp. COAC-50 TaxID=2729384 RepID=UPI0015547284|nr:hypothetical protein [Niveibacterium sp. COAC-50]